MKLYVTYFVTMENSSEVSQVSIFGQKASADAEFSRLKALEAEYMEDLDGDDDGDWAEAFMEEFEVGPVRLYDSVAVAVEVMWYEVVEVTLKVFVDQQNAIGQALHYIDEEKARLVEEDPELVPFDDDETFNESMHLCNDDAMSDYYFHIFAFTID